MISLLFPLAAAAAAAPAPAAPPVKRPDFVCSATPLPPAGPWRADWRFYPATRQGGEGPLPDHGFALDDGHSPVAYIWFYVAESRPALDDELAARMNATGAGEARCGETSNGLRIVLLAQPHFGSTAYTAPVPGHGASWMFCEIELGAAESDWPSALPMSLHACASGFAEIAQGKTILTRPNR
ncbi:hypothetical protein E2493_08740 [Sphingomonas parva]|uniref:Uncharacterized protein n=1 Tax=Sphingomonas parva TaxID=2555898 RepID=A0A4Y8ZVE5_9SPHN|nr:hypothetical protein [Sphingomonas parva]TFI58709.1 hypothetical protein E2493_08740 [Sphingomonas parva]